MLLPVQVISQGLVLVGFEGTGDCLAVSEDDQGCLMVVETRRGKGRQEEKGKEKKKSRSNVPTALSTGIAPAGLQFQTSGSSPADLLTRDQAPNT